MPSEQKGDIPKFIRRVMPGATDVELQEATETLKQCMAVALRIYTRTKREERGTDSPEAGL
jgi:hypothetical protein